MPQNLELFDSDWKYGVVGLREELFDVVAAFTDVMQMLEKAIPGGLNAEEDKTYQENRRDDLLECTLLIFHRVNELLQVATISPSEEETKEWEIIHKPQNKILESLFKFTHSQRDFQIFTPEVYEAVKSEKKF